MTSAERKAAIKRATELAQRDMRSLDKNSAADLLTLYQQAATDLQNQITELAGRDPVLSLSVLQELLRQIEQRITLLSSSVADLIVERINSAATLGAQGAFATAEGLAVTAAALNATQFVTTFIAKDGLQLSDRLWRLDAGAKESLAQAIRRSVILGNGASQAAADLLRQGQPVPGDVSDMIDLRRVENIRNQIGDLLNRAPGSAYANALRLMRTEINRAHGEAYQNGLHDNDLVAGVRFTLSPGHPRPDICDMHASLDLFGMGAGVYPVGGSPWPAHPNTLSFVVAVFADEVPEQRTPEHRNRLQWLEEQPESVQTAVLNSRDKVEALHQGLLEDSDIELPWRDIAARLEQAGYAVAA